jgi:anthranilate/para-aminobenzoate synthase component I
MGLSKFAAQDLPQKKMKVQTAEKSTAKIHQYIFNGKVIAVSWSGHKTPDLSVLLGSHFQLYSHGKKLQPAPRGQRFQRIEHEGLVYQSAGHMRGIRGYAFLAPLPAGIHEEDFAASP